RSKSNSWSLIHPTAYYTLNAIPTGEKLALASASTKNSAAASTAKKPGAAKPTTSGKLVAAKVPTFAEVQPLLSKYTCLACHNTEKKQVGPGYRDVAKRGYSNEQIVELIYNPKPENWPDYATPMPPMPQVPKGDALKIASWINSLNKKTAASTKPVP
ncbi:MAG: hypothetical protein H7Y12_00070, partial [Sphingobacteriaceae bacterium]|nr:hypothetical protein [Cytophagaceae bacterium]